MSDRRLWNRRRKAAAFVLAFAIAVLVIAVVDGSHVQVDIASGLVIVAMLLNLSSFSTKDHD